MKSSFFLAAAAAAMVTSGCATAPTGTSVAGDLTPESASTYVELAGASDMFEIESSQLALSRSQDEEVRQFAQTMIEHHTQTTQQLLAAARSAGLTPTPTLMPMQVEMMDALRQAQGEEFDRLYTSQQVQAHEMAVALHSTYASEGDVPELTAVAAAATPIVTQHLARIREIQN